MVSSRGRHVFDFTSLTDEGIGVQSPNILNRAQWTDLQVLFLLASKNSVAPDVPVVPDVPVAPVVPFRVSRFRRCPWQPTRART